MKKSAKPKQRGVGRTLRIYEYEGKKYSLSELARMANMKPAAMLYRLNHWTSIELCVKKSVREGRSPKYSFKGHKNSEQRLNELREKYKNGVTAEIMQEFAENLQIPRDSSR